jgi:hypothetical protein
MSLRRDAELGFVVAATASLLLSPLLWDHYLAMLILPAAFLAERGRAAGLLLPLLAWLPGEAFPWLVILATVLPFWAPDPEHHPRRRPSDRLGIADGPALSSALPPT